MSSDEQLIYIASLLKARNYEQARAELTAYLKTNPNQPEAWYLMSFAVGERARQIAALERALKIDPSFAKASTRLIKLQTAGVAQPAGQSSRRTGLILLAVMGLGLLIVVGIILILPSLSTTKPMPTALAMPPTDTPKPPTLVAANPPTDIPTATNVVVTTAPGSTASGTVATLPPDVPPTDTSVPETIAPQSTTVGEAPSNTPDQAGGVAPTATPDQGVSVPTVEPPQASATTGGATAAPGNPTATLAPTTPAAPTLSPTPSSTVSGDPGIPLQSPFKFDNGNEMRVISASFPATNALKDIGVTAPAPPAGSQWALIEAFMTCTQNVNCGPDSGSMKILGVSGKTYPVTTAFSVSPMFGPDGYTPGQVWGYLEFAVANNEQPLRLVLTQGNQTYTFALQ